MRLLTLCLLIFFASRGHAQPYFQQETDYDIEVRLDDNSQELLGKLTLEYTNNSPDELSEIPFHLWPRAYSKPTTAYGKQELRTGSTRFWFAEEADRGTLDGLNFTVDGQPADFRFDDIHTDIGYLTLNEGLEPGAKITIRTPFRVKVPASFSRLGRVGDSYQLTQWYPKPSVYDASGWHAMPYLDQGEFYSEFGSFRVQITVPERYVVGATGVLQEVGERERLLALAAGVPTTIGKGQTPTDTSGTRTLTYLAEQVHDFAWFADPDFQVRHDTLQLPGRDPVDVWAFFTGTEADLWAEATNYLKRSVRFYSDHIGTYPYPQVTGVESALSAGGGMEYPMITVIGYSGDAESLDEVLAHEVGHNWFYGILGSNERDHPWMDEGINSYYEQRYMAEYYPGRSQEYVKLPGGAIDQDLLGYRYAQRQGKDQAPDTRSDSLAPMNYWLSAYTKPALALHRVADLVGEPALDAAMRFYYERYKFAHPQPEGFLGVMRTELGAETDSLLRRALLTTDDMDWEAAPREGSPVKFGTGQDRPGAEVFFAPLAGFNDQDGFMAGAALHNRSLEPKAVEWVVAPLYGFRSKTLAGFAGVRARQIRPWRGVREFRVSAGIQRFSDNRLETDTVVSLGLDQTYQYTRLAGTAELIFDTAPIRQRENRLYAQVISLARQRPDFEGSPVPLDDPRTLSNGFARLGFLSQGSREINPLSYGIRLEYKSKDDELFADESHLRLDWMLNGANQYQRGKFLRYRLYAGYFFRNENRERASYPASSLSLIGNAASDYAYDGLYLGRGSDGGYEQQIEARQGGFRAPVSPSFNFGRSNDYLLALNLDAELPVPLPLGVFLDAGTYRNKAVSNDPLTGQFNWVGGVSLTFLSGNVGLYLPLVADPDTKELLDQRGGVFDKLSFRLNLSGLLPWKLADSVF